MTVTVVAVHPAVVMVEADGRRLEIPIHWFPQPPKTGQQWDLTLKHQPTDPERLAKLNDYLSDAA